MSRRSRSGWPRPAHRRPSELVQHRRVDDAVMLGDACPGRRRTCGSRCWRGGPTRCEATSAGAPGQHRHRRRLPREVVHGPSGPAQGTDRLLQHQRVPAVGRRAHERLPGLVFRGCRPRRGTRRMGHGQGRDQRLRRGARFKLQDGSTVKTKPTAVDTDTTSGATARRPVWPAASSSSACRAAPSTRRPPTR